MAAKGTAGRRVGQYPDALKARRYDVVEAVDHGAGVQDGYDAIATVGAAALLHSEIHGGDGAVCLHADLHLDLALGAAAMGDEGLFPA